jgi:hypothetical protein
MPLKTDKPALFYVLAAFGLLIGSFGGMFALSKAAPLLGSRDQYISAYREFAEKLPGHDAQSLKMAEQEADAIYSRRGVALPLAAMNLILSTLLFLGCGRALRGSPWGLSAWQLAVVASLPYTLLASAFAIVEAREIAAAMPHDAVVELGVQLSILRTAIFDGLAIVYYLVCILYLRRPAIRKRFLPPAA